MLKKTLLAALFAATATAPAHSACEKPSVFQITKEADLIGGIKAEGQTGDYKLCNELVEAVIEGDRMSDGLAPYGGMPIDLIRRDGSKNDLYGEFLPLFNVGGNQFFKFRAFKPASFKTEMRGDKAVLVVQGEDGVFPILEGLLRLPTTPHKLKITYEYELASGSDDLLMRILIEPAKKTSVVLGMGYMMGDGLERFAPGMGYNLKNTTNKRFDWMGATGPGFSSIWALAGSNFQIMFSQGTYFFGQYERKTAEPGKPAVYELHTLVGNGDIEPYRLRADEIVTGKKPGQLKSFKVILNHPAQPAALDGRTSSVQVHLATATTPPKFFSTAKTQQVNGKDVATFQLPPGVFKVMAGEEGLGFYTHATIDTSKAEQVILNRPPSGILKVGVTGKGEGPMPAILLVKPLQAMEELPEEVGQKTLAGKYVRHVFMGPNGAKLALRPGKYEVTATRGFEYGVVTKTVEIKAGQASNLPLTLTRQIDTTGWFSGDFHLHAMPSPDSDDTLEEKVLALAASGVALPVATDHNVITDYGPAIKKLKLEDFTVGVIGMELTTFNYGHFNMFPMTYEPQKANNGFDLMDYPYKTVPELFTFVLNQSGPDTITQINHPRAPSVGGFFNATSYQRTLGKAVNEKNFPPGFTFDVIEAFNGKRVEQLEETLPDWYSFLSRGRRVWSAGNSDSHHMYKFEAGYPRNYVYTGHKKIRDVSIKAFRDAVKAGKFVVSGGHFITITSGGKMPGELAPAKGGKAQLQVKVQAADWVDAKTLKVIVNGAVVQTINIPQSTKPVRYNQAIPLTLDKDSFVLVRVDGSNKLEPIYPGATPTSFTNPIFFDVNGNGKFDAPLGGGW